MPEKGFYTLEDLREEVRFSRSFEERAKATVRGLEERIIGALEKSKIRGRVALCGSTNPERFTAIVDTSDQYGRNHPDIDCYVITKREVDSLRVQEIANRIYEGGVQTEEQGNPTYRFRLDGFSVELSFLDEAKAKETVTLQYLDRVRPPTPQETLEIQAATLLCKRLGVYGGFTDAIKRVAIEEMIRGHGSLDQVLSVLHHDLSKGQGVVVTSSLTGRNLVSTVHSDVWRRLGSALTHNFELDGGVPSGPYGYLDWYEDHEMQYAVSFGFPFLEGESDRSLRQVYQLVSRMVRRSAKARKETLHEPVVFVQPYSVETAIDVATNSLTHPLGDSEKYWRTFFNKLGSFVKQEFGSELF